MFGQRKERLGQQLQQEIAMILQRDLKDPRIGFVTITRVELSSDLSYARVGYSCLGDAAMRTEVEATLQRATGFIRQLMKKRLRLRIIPTLAFRYDPTVAGSIALSEKLDALNRPALDADPAP